MSNTGAIYNGGLANKPRFFGSSTSEIVSLTGANGNWNSGRSESVRATDPWFYMGALSGVTNYRGIFSSAHTPGSTSSTISHRTILLGY
ncbi:hypothetical protein FWG76_00750 [Candidatus Saccharibacteria bacterium]|nr:hypothetical protein [Candidatus Saccharibacteria bacterium]